MKINISKFIYVILFQMGQQLGSSFLNFLQKYSNLINTIKEYISFWKHNLNQTYKIYPSNKKLMQKKPIKVLVVSKVWWQWRKQRYWHRKVNCVKNHSIKSHFWSVLSSIAVDLFNPSYDCIQNYWGSSNAQLFPPVSGNIWKLLVWSKKGSLLPILQNKFLHCSKNSCSITA